MNSHQKQLTALLDEIHSVNISDYEDYFFGTIKPTIYGN